MLDTAGNLFSSGRMARVPLLVGSTSFDLPGWFPSSKKQLFSQFGPDADAARRLYDPAGSTALLSLLVSVGADAIMQEPARFVARTMSRAGAQSWLYRFDYIADSARATAPGAEHASDVPYLFNTLAERYPDKVTPRDQATSDAFSGYIANFAKSGNPNGPGLPEWRPMTPTSSELMMFANDGARMRDDPWKERLDLTERMATTQPKPVPVAQLALGDWSGFAALGVLHVPKHLGSKESSFVPFPFAEMRYRDRLFLATGTTGLGGVVGARVYRSSHWEASSQLSLTERRAEYRSDALAGMSERSVGVALGGSLRRQNGRYNQSLSITQGLNTGAGLSANVSTGVTLPISIIGALGLSATATIADRQQMKFLFGVTPDEAQRRKRLVAAGDPRLRPIDATAYSPGGGIQSVGLTGTATMMLRRKLLAAGVGGVSYLMNPAAQSPLVQRRAQRIFGVGLGYRLY